MEEPTTTDQTESPRDRLSSTPQDLGTGLLRSAGGTTTLLNRWGTPASDQRYIAETLEWITGELGAKRARFVRLLPTGIWIVQTVVQGKIVAQPADRAEIAMAWAVSLNGDVYSASRPRVVTSDGSGIRPIAVTTYLAIPVLCQQGLAGVIEAAGKLKPGAERIARSAGERLADLAVRLMFDPGLRAEPRVTPQTECEISVSLSSSNVSHLTADEWKFIGILNSPKTLHDIAAELDWPDRDAVDTARDLVARGVITLRTPTGELTPAAPVASQRELAELHAPA